MEQRRSSFAGSLKYSFLLPYYDRAVQLHNTLVSYYDHYRGRDDWEVILVEDVKNLNDKKLHEEFIEVLAEFSELPVGRLASTVQNTNPAPHYNMAAAFAAGRYLLLSSPEVFHVADILAGADRVFAECPASYFICGCMNVLGLGRIDKIDRTTQLKFREDRWYQHSEKRPACYHFCTVIPADTYWDVGGFDEEFKDGISYEDNDFRDRVYAAGVKFVQEDQALTLHQDHTRHHRSHPNKKQLLGRNKKLYDRKLAERGGVRWEHPSIGY